MHAKQPGSSIRVAPDRTTCSLHRARRSLLCVIPHPRPEDRGGSMAGEDQARDTGTDTGSLSRRSFLALSAAAAASVVLPAIDNPAVAAGNCQPFLTPPDYLGIVPTTEQVLGFEAGRREV